MNTQETDVRIAELKRMVGKLTLELDLAKKPCATRTGLASQTDMPVSQANQGEVSLLTDAPALNPQPAAWTTHPPRSDFHARRLLLTEVAMSRHADFQSPTPARTLTAHTNTPTEIQNAHKAGLDVRLSGIEPIAV